MKTPETAASPSRDRVRRLRKARKENGLVRHDAYVHHDDIQKLKDYIVLLNKARKL